MAVGARILECMYLKSKQRLHFLLFHFWPHFVARAPCWLGKESSFYFGPISLSNFIGDENVTKLLSACTRPAPPACTENRQQVWFLILVIFLYQILMGRKFSVKFYWGGRKPSQKFLSTCDSHKWLVRAPAAWLLGTESRFNSGPNSVSNFIGGRKCHKIPVTSQVVVFLPHPDHFFYCFGLWNFISATRLPKNCCQNFCQRTGDPNNRVESACGEGVVN